MRNDTGKLDQLTSLRFFAAFMIVIHHSDGLFGVTFERINLGQGVSFFFVLSGFILTYVYPKLDTFADFGQFWRARIARIWPAYSASLFLGFVLVGYHWQSGTGIPFLMMLQAWIPISDYYFSYNAVCWSVSTEFFFYLAFPFIIHNLSRTWLPKLLLSGAIVIGLIVAGSLLAIPAYNAPTPSLSGGLVTQHGLVYISPLSRIFEFIFGMCISLAWINTRNIVFDIGSATVLELGTIAICVLSLAFTPVGYTYLNANIALWVGHSGSMFAFGLLIYVMALGKGAISRSLAHPFLVLLGEISFSIYLSHQILLVYFRSSLPDLARLSGPLALSAFLAILLPTSYLMWAWVEMPGRQLLVGQKKLHGSEVMRASWYANFALSRKPLVAALILVGVIGFAQFVAPSLMGVKEGPIADITPTRLQDYVGTEFGTRFILHGLDLDCEADGLRIKLLWESKSPQKLESWVFVHIIDGAGAILTQADYRQLPKDRYVPRGARWLDEHLIGASQLRYPQAQRLAIGIYRDRDAPLVIDRGPRDWDGRRLIIPIGPCPAPQPHPVPFGMSNR